MDSPSPKRRRTSPHASNTNLSAVSIGDNPQVFNQPSFMTPTKASLARFHPQLLNQPNHSTTPRSRGRLLLNQRSSTLKGSLRPPTNVSKFSRPDSVATAPSLNSIAHTLTDSRAGDSSQARELTSTTTHVPHSNRTINCAPGPPHEVADQEPRASPPPEVQSESGSVPATGQDFDDVLVDDPQKSPESGDPGIQAQATVQSLDLEPNEHSIESQPKILAITNHEDKWDDDIVTISTPSRHRATFTEDDEPKLPSTPRQLGIEPPGTKPTGILSMSPSRSGKRRRAPSTKSSPLKQRNAALEQQVFETDCENSLGPRPQLASGEAARVLEPLEYRLERDPALSILPTYKTSKLPETDPLYGIQDTVSLDITVSDVLSSKDGRGTAYRDAVLHSPGDTLIAQIRLFLKDTGKVASIAIIALTSWASELAKWLNAPIADRTQDAVVKAVGHFWDMAEIRAFCWYKCEGDFKHLLDATGHVATETAPEVAETYSDKNRVELAIKSHIGQPGAGSVSEALGVEILYRCMGLDFIRLRDSAVTLQVIWTVNFTPSGKVTSRVSAHASFPSSWGDEEGDDLTRTDEAFKRLVQSRKSVHEAMLCIVEVMFPGGS